MTFAGGGVAAVTRAFSALGACVAIGFAALPAPSVSASANPNQINPDPVVRFGVLPNGLRYALMRNGAPKGGVSIRLGVEVGSFEENAGERGIAHFLEHLAYGDTKSFPEADLLKTFAAKGVAFGRDQNAQTTLHSTTYELDLPSGDPASLDLGFRWLREVADGVQFRLEKVEKERRVVLAERSVRDTPMAAYSEAKMGFLQRGLRSPERPPEGFVADLAAIGPEQLKTFHARWYRPDSAVVVAIGDLPVEELESRVRDSFSSWAAQGPAPTRPPYGKPDDTRGEEVFVRRDAGLVPAVGACRVHAVDWAAPRDVARLRREVTRKIWIAVLNDRLVRAANVTNRPFFGAHAYALDGGREAEAVCLSAVPIGGDWARGLKVADLELKRLAAAGITEDELDHALESERAQYRGAVSHAGTRTSDQLAADLMDSELDHDVFASPAERFRAFDDAVEGLAPGEVLTAFKRDWSGAGPLLIADGPTPPDEQALRLAWDTDEATALASAATVEEAPLAAAPGAPARTAAWAYTDFGRPGRVVERQVFKAPDFVRLTFANGVVVNFKATKFAADSILIRVRFGHGRRGLASADVATAMFGAALFEAGGLGRHDFQDVRTIFHEGAWDAALSVGNDAFVLRGETTRNGFEDQLEILTAYVSDPGFRSTVDPLIPSALQAAYRVANSQPVAAASEALDRTFAPGLALPPVDQFEHVKSADFERLFKPALTQAPLEITLVGDVDEAVATRLLAKAFGALPVRKAAPAPADGGGWLRFSDASPRELHAVHEGASDKAAVLAAWPLYVAKPERRREELALNMVADLLTNSLRQRVREELGYSYDPSAATEMPDHADQGYLLAEVETSVEAAPRVAAEVRAAAERLAKGDISPEALETVRRPLLAKWTQRVQTNSWWMGDLDGSARGDHPVEDPSYEAGVYASLTLAEIRKAAADWLSREPIVVTALPATTAAPSMPAKTATR